MYALREMQQQFATALFAADGIAPACADAGRSDTAERFAIYRRAIFANYRNALRATYPVVERLVGVPFFGAAVEAFVRAHPPRSGDLNVYGDRFGAFLAAYPPAADLPYLPDVARLEWAFDDAHRAEDDMPAPDRVLAALSAVPADRLPGVRFRLAPGCRIVGSNYPILRIWQVNQPDYAGDDRVQLGVASADPLLVRRDAVGVGIERLPVGEFAWLAALADGASFAAAIEAAQAADAGFDLGRALHTHIGKGTIASIVAG